MTDIFNVHVVVARESCLYFDYLIRNFRHTARNPERLFFFCYALDKETFAQYKDSPDITAAYPVYDRWRSYRRVTWAEWRVFLKAKITGVPGLGGSNGHSAGLNYATEQMPLMKGHHLIADSDVAVLVRDWDIETERLFHDYQIIGTPYEDIGGFSSGSGKVQTYKKFPNVIWLAIREDCDLSDMDWFPNKQRNIEIDTEEKSALYNLPLGYELVCDVGWKFPDFCAKRGYRVLTMTQVKPTSVDAQIIRSERDYNEEYQVHGHAFVAHQRGGSRHAFRESEIPSFFYDCVENAVGVPA
jgi:hypothetical protein